MYDPSRDFRRPEYKVVTVFGGGGFIGRHLVKRLAQRGWRVRLAVRHPGRAMFLQTYGAVGQIAPVFADVRDDASVAAAVRGADYVINLVGILFESGRQQFEALHAEAPGRIARLAREAGATRMVHISAIGASPDSPSVYARTKARGEQAAREAFPEVTILRPSIVFGPEDNFFNLFATLARLSPVMPLMGGGETRFQPVYVGDVADAIMAALDDPAAQGRTYELGGPRVYTFRELMELTLAQIGRKRLLVSIPWSLAEVQGKVLGMLPAPLLTLDQVKQLRIDNVVADDAPTLRDLGIAPTAAEAVLPSYLERFRRGGRFAGRRLAG